MRHCCAAAASTTDCTAVYKECPKGLVCYNGGQCTEGESPGEQACACPTKWTGATCKVPVEMCSNGTSRSDLHCMNGGSCAYDADAREYFCK